MKFEEILEGIKMLAQNQGLYGRLLAEIENSKINNIDRYNCYKESFESQNFKNIVDFVIWFES